LRTYHLLWQLFFFGLPLLFIMAAGFWIIDNHALRPALTFENYRLIMIQPQFSIALVNSIRLSSACALTSVIVGLPVGFSLAFLISQRHRAAIVVLLLVPYFSSYIVRLFSWQVWLMDNGILSYLFTSIGQSRRFLYTEIATVIGITSVTAPLASIAIFISFLGAQRESLLVGRNLGASRLQLFVLLQLPYAWPGLLLGFLYSFLVSLGDVAAPSILGGNKVLYLSNLITNRVSINDTPVAAALATILLLLSTLFMVGIFAISRQHEIVSREATSFRGR
jgi:spermidine/putrescine transport system permease protein